MATFDGTDGADWGAVGQVFLQKFAAAVETPGVAKATIKKIWILLFIIGLIPFSLVLIGGESIFKMALGDDWLHAGSVAMMLAPMAFAMFISSPTSGAYVVLGLQKYSLIFGAIVFIYRPSCIYIGHEAGSLAIGIKLWVVLETIQIFMYQLIVWKKIESKK